MEMVLFQRQRTGKVSTKTKSLKDLVSMISATQFLEDSKRSSLLEKMQDYSGLEPSRYESLCTNLVEHLIHYCQSLPESVNSYYAQPGGLIDHALNRTEAALSLFQEFLIKDQAEPLSEEQKLWQYVLYSAALLQGIGKLVTDFTINQFDVNGQLLKHWNPLLESLDAVGSYFDYEFLKESDPLFRRRVNLLMAKAIIPASGFAWIAGHQQALAVWLALLNEDQQGAGTLGAILIRADALAIQRYFAEFLARASAGRAGPFGRAGTFSGGAREQLGTKEQMMGVEFIQWMMHSLEKGIIMINKAPLFMVPGGMLMCQEMFQLFVREHPEYKNWQAAQKAFLSLGVHSLGADGSVTSTFQQTHTNESHSGIVFSHFALALPASVTVHMPSNGETRTMSAVEFIHYAQENHDFMPPGHLTVAPFEKLAASGQWQVVVTEAPGVASGVKYRV